MLLILEGFIRGTLRWVAIRPRLGSKHDFGMGGYRGRQEALKGPTSAFTCDSVKCNGLFGVVEPYARRSLARRMTLKPLK
jgi:hypothetical protein